MIPNLNLLIIILLQTSKCVLSQESERAAIVQGTLAKLGQFPYVVNINNSPRVKRDRRNAPGVKGWLCTGSILTELWVVTGTHCYSGYAGHNISLAEVTTEITAGTIDLQQNTTHTQRRTSTHHVMMDKNPQKKGKLADVFNNDVALLKVTEPFVFNENVGPITIAKRPLPEGKKLTCIVMGYGRTEPTTEFDTFNLNKKLYYTTAILDGDKFSCRKRAKKRGETHAEHWGEEHICMDPVDYRSTPCNGDSGGPIVCDGLEVGTSIGRLNINDEHASCGAKGNYHVYTFLGYYEDWLKNHIPDLLPFKLVTSPSEKSDTSGCADTRFRVADIGLLLFIHFILLLLSITH